MTKSNENEDTSQVVIHIREGDKIGVLMFLRQGGDPTSRNNMGWTLLHLACLEGQAEIAEILLDAGAMVNCCTTDMCTPLHLASVRGNKKAVEVLTAKGAYVNAQDKAGNTPLHEAAKAFHTPIVKFLIEKKADMQRVNKKGQIFINLVGQQMMPTVECGDVDVLLEWLDWGLSANTVGNLNWSLLHHASARGQINIASLLLERGADVNVLDSNRSSPLHSACFHGHKRIAELLLGRGANINAKDQRGNTPLHSAISGEHPDVINLLLENECDTTIVNKEGQIFTHLVNEFLIDAVDKSRIAHVMSLLKGRADPDTKDSSGYPILCCAAFKGDLLVTDALLEAGANPNICSEDTLKTPLHYATSLSHLFVMKALLDKGASVSCKDKNDSIPLHEAAREGDQDVVTILLGRGSSINAQDSDGNTPLHVAARWGQTAIVEMLLEKGASEEIKNKSGLLYSDLALMRAVRTEDANQVMAGLAWGGNPNVQDSKGWTLLHHAVYKSAHEVCFVILEAEANVNISNKHGRTPLLLASYKGDRQIVEMLLDAGADPNVRDNENYTSLHWAAEGGNIDTVELLLSKGANRNMRNRKGLLYTDLLLKHLYFAVRHNDESRVESLLKVGADQTAELRGTEITPREEAKRRKYYPILRKMISLAPSKPPPKPNKDDFIVLEDVRKLFEENEDDVPSDESSSESDKEEIDPDEDAYWKMHNAPLVLDAKDLLEDVEKSFWDHWEEKHKVIPAKEFFKNQEAWWETVSSSSDENDSEVIPTFEDMKKTWGTVVPAKEFFREDECWWRDAVEDLDKPKIIKAKDFFKEEQSWWEQNSSDTSDEETEETNNEEFWPRNKKVIPAHEFFKEDTPWWVENSSEEETESDTKEFSSCAEKESKNEEKSEEEESMYEDIEESITDEWDTANDSIISDSSTMYSASEGDKLLAANLFVEKPWWYDQDDDLMDNALSDNSISAEEELSEDKSDKTETTEIADDGSYTEKDRFSRHTCINSTESDASTNIILDAMASNSTENLLELDNDDDDEDSANVNDACTDDKNVQISELNECELNEFDADEFEHEQFNISEEKSLTIYPTETPEVHNMITTVDTNSENKNIHNFESFQYEVKETDNIRDNQNQIIEEQFNILFQQSKDCEENMDINAFLNKSNEENIDSKNNESSLIKSSITQNETTNSANNEDKGFEDISYCKSVNSTDQNIFAQVIKNDFTRNHEECTKKEDECIEIHSNVKYSNSIVNTPTKNPYSLFTNEVEDKPSIFSVDKVCHLDIDCDVASNISHSLSDTDTQDIKAIQTSNVKFKDVKNDDVDAKQKVCDSMEEKLGTDKNPVINKMNACLARVDATLAWLDARMANDSAMESGRNQSEMLKCKMDSKNKNNGNHIHINNNQTKNNNKINNSNINNNLNKNIDYKTQNLKDLNINNEEKKENAEKFQILRIKVRITDNDSSNILEHFLERNQLNELDICLKGSSSENALYDAKQIPSHFNKVEENKIKKYNSIAKLETIGSQTKDDLTALRACNPFVMEDFINNSRDKDITNTTSSKLQYSKSSSSLIVRRHSFGEINLKNFSCSEDNLHKKSGIAKRNSKLKEENSINISDKEFKNLAQNEKCTTEPLKIRRHSLEDICAQNLCKIESVSQNSYEKTLNETSSQHESHKNTCTNNRFLDNSSKSTSNKLNNQNFIYVKDAKTDISFLPEEKIFIKCNTQLIDNISKANDKSKSDRNALQKQKDISKITNFDAKAKNYLSCSSSNTIENCKAIPRENTGITKVDPVFSSSPEKSNWMWSTFHTKSLNEYDKLINSCSKECKPISILKKCKSIEYFDKVNDVSFDKDKSCTVKVDKNDKVQSKNVSHENLERLFPTNQCVAESNIRIKPPLPPRRNKDNRQAANINEKFDNTNIIIKNSDTNKKCLLHNLGQKQTSELEVPVASSLNQSEKIISSDVDSDQNLDKYIPDSTPKPPPRKYMKMKDEVKRSSSCSLC